MKLLLIMLILLRKCYNLNVVNEVDCANYVSTYVVNMENSLFLLCLVHQAKDHAPAKNEFSANQITSEIFPS